MTPVDLLVIAVIAFIGGVIGSVLVNLRFWATFVRDLYRHGFDNHLCADPACCSTEALRAQLRSIRR